MIKFLIFFFFFDMIFNIYTDSTNPTGYLSKMTLFTSSNDFWLRVRSTYRYLFYFDLIIDQIEVKCKEGSAFYIWEQETSNAI